jgi:arylsulfatase A-like enzyme
LIAHWPAGISAKCNGKLEAETGHLIDVMATCVDLANATYPQEFNNTPIQALEGISLRPTFEGAAIDRQAPLCWEHEGNRAIRVGSWKLVSRYPGGWELYDIEADRTEMVDLSKLHSARVQEMSGLWEAWANRVGVKPWAVVEAAGRKKAK